MKKEMPERRCIATGESGPVAGLIRFVVGPDAQIVPDLAEKLPGRGIWVSADRAALDKASARGLFSRAAKTHVKVPKELAAEVETLLAKRLVDRLSMGRKAGQVIAGFEKVKTLLMTEEAAILFQAVDGSGGSKKKLRSPGGADAYFECLTAQDLGLAFGRDRVIHAAVKFGGFVDPVLNDALRLKGVQGLGTGNGRNGQPHMEAADERLGRE